MTKPNNRQLASAAKRMKCAIYTRKSTEDGLEQEFNSLDAQRESGEAYVKSQAHQGWDRVPDQYDDGGFTGGNMDRPTLRRLIADIEAGKVDCVVVYKVDRLSRVLKDLFRTGRAKRIRPLLQFAGEEIVIPEGRYRGRKWRPHFQPFTGLYFALIDEARFTHYIVTGCVQSGKSFASFVVPAIYHLFELEEPVILAAPTMDIARDKWRLEIKPVLEQTRFAALMPSHGSGSRKGWSEMIQFRNGAVLKFMSGHGGDEKRSSFTSRVVIITEADKMDESGAASEESSPVRQILARTESFDIEDVRAYFECTVSIETGFIWREYHAGTASRLVSPCPQCHAWVAPGREQLVGWQDAPTAYDAEDLAHWICPNCGKRIDEPERLAMLRQMRVLHQGQSLDMSGQVQGIPPRTRQLGYRWTAWHNAFWSTKKIAHGEWRAVHETGGDDVEMYRKQFVWVEPYQPLDVETIRLDEAIVTARRPHIRRGIVPDWCGCLTVGIDVGKYWLHWVAVAWRKNLSDTGENGIAAGIVDYGTFQVDGTTHEEQSIEQAIVRFCTDQLTDRGFVLQGTSDIRIPELVLIDAGYQTHVVRHACRQLDRRRFYPVLGRGAGQHHARAYLEPTRQGNTTVRLGERRHVSYLPKTAQHEFEADVDHWKSWLTRRLTTPSGPGSLVLYEAEPREHQNIYRHFTAEQESRYFDVHRNREVNKWERVRKSNHYFDAATYATIVANFYGVTLLESQHQERQRAEETWARIFTNIKEQREGGAARDIGEIQRARLNGARH